jgi:Mg-chelatase subunit ChlD
VHAQLDAVCGLKKLRGEMLKMDQKREIIQDCEVSEWVPSACSHECGGGQMELRRAIISPPTNGGAECPPLRMQKACNVHACAVDCKVGDWENWGKCSAECGGGVRERTRPVIQEAANGGQPCPEDHISESCNTQACDVDCVLAEWSEWTPCSKACDLGFQRRHRGVLHPAEGSGNCWGEEAPPRLQYKRCNEQKCEAGLKCEAEMDFIIALDASASVGETNFELVKKFAAELVNRMVPENNNVQAGAIIFSGPTTVDDVMTCNNEGDEKACGVHLVSALTDKVADVAGKISALKFIGASTNTGGALALAKTMLMEGRKNAQSTILVVTDGAPNFMWKAKEVSHELQQQARVVFLSAAGTPDSIVANAQLASKPPRENLLGATYQTIEKRAQEILVDVCSNVVKRD